MKLILECVKNDSPVNHAMHTPLLYKIRYSLGINRKFITCACSSRKKGIAVSPNPLSPPPEKLQHVARFCN